MMWEADAGSEGNTQVHHLQILCRLPVDSSSASSTLVSAHASKKLFKS